MYGLVINGFEFAFHSKENAIKFADDFIQFLKDRIGKDFSSVSNNKWHFANSKAYRDVSIYDFDNKETVYSFKIEEK